MKNLEISRLSILMKALLLLISLSTPSFTKCKSAIKLSGSISVSTCNPEKEKCISSGKAVYDYTEAYTNDSTELSVAINSSPWHFYDPDMRIVRVKELAKQIKSALKPHNKYIFLLASWSGVNPDSNTQSLAFQLSKELNDFPVKGVDGFVWLSKNGKIRTTKQAFTMFSGTYSKIREGDDVFVSMTYSWPIQFEEKFIDEKDSKGILMAGAGWDIFNLCPDYALDRFKTSLALSNPLGGYNSAIILLEKMTHADSLSAIEMLRKSAKLGDIKSREYLNELAPRP